MIMIYYYAWGGGGAAAGKCLDFAFVVNTRTILQLYYIKDINPSAYLLQAPNFVWIIIFQYT